ncbi:hypothetical protein GCM10007063_11210 [Lentibacillus kapialis]|uniref:site-specific DNA-methyltransferase (adenine-specific) n=1 Tax=Lentibacillus kapialis TaxID=340214 RepID=A0A917UWE8_9BACI|nr:TaqI-like C-terminal specificity domain-containing protein [Lentibacillus kapialis]GGJ90375.1 hypothetical protein GCM10007063_11210 [Lentibacillus kapialis]
MYRFNRIKTDSFHISNSTNGKVKNNGKPNRDKMFNGFYREYQSIRKKLFENLQQLNNELTECVLFKKTTKILDWVIFICFCEDFGLLPNRVFRQSLQEKEHALDPRYTDTWEQLKELIRTIKQEHAEKDIHHIDSALLEEDPVLNQMTVQNAVFPLFKKLIRYDFATDLDINVLGRIFEQSINDMEVFKANMTGINNDLLQSKRKKDGIFYTSPDVTRVLLQETLLKWVDDRKQELAVGFPEDHTNKINESDQVFREYLQSIRILDPSAGSGAFLSMAYDMLINEWVKAFEEPVGMEFANNHMITDNLFGVELNAESLELAKLILSFKSMAQQQKWPMFQDNLKTGNAIIDHPDISDQAFDWNQSFPKIMREGGFDIIIGNPPYVFARDEGFTQAEKNYFNRRYSLADYQINTYLLFIERSYHLLKAGGWLGFIIPNNLLTIDSCKKIRRFLLENTGNLKIINSHNRMFDQADVNTCLLIFQKAKPTTVKLGEFNHENVEVIAEVEPETLLDEQSIINISLMKNKRAHDIMHKIEAGSHSLGSVATVKSGLVAYEVGRGNPEQTKEMKENRVYHSDFQVDDTYWRYVEGRDVCRYSIEWGGSWLKYGPNLAARRNEEIFTKPRILVRQIPSKLTYAIHAAYTEAEILNDRNSNNIIDFQKDPLFLLGMINSKITTFWFIHKFDKFQRKMFPQFKVKDLKMFPIPVVSETYMKLMSKTVAGMHQVQRQKGEVMQPTDMIIQKEKCLNEQLDKYAAAAFGLNDEDVRMIDAYWDECLE